MATPAQIAANRRNALKSTGPRTAAGKSASSRNALRHGLVARAAVIRGEDPADFARFRAELRQALAPRDGREAVLAETAVQAAWQLRRAWRAEAALFNRQGQSDSACLRELLILQRYEVAANHRFHRAVAMLERGRTLEQRKRASAPSRSRPCRHGRTCSGHPRVLGASGSVSPVVFPRSNRPLDSSCPGLSRASTFSSATKGHVDGRDKHGHDDNGGSDSERRRQDTLPRRRVVRNRGFCRRNPIWVPGPDTQPLGAARILRIRPSELAFAESRLISWKRARKARQRVKKPLDCALAWPSWVGLATRAAVSPSADRALMTPD